MRRGGVILRRTSGGEGWRHLGVFYPATTTLGGLSALASEDLVARVDLDVLPMWAVPPLAWTAVESQAQATWRGTAASGYLPLTGKGVVIGSIDGGIDVYHPAFFRADGGLFVWIDVDKNGRFDLGKDAVDLNHDGKAGPGEVLHLIDARVTDVHHQATILGSVNGRFDLRHDWLFADTNGNGKRDFGAAAGFDDKTPTFGEPLFVADDVNGDGILGTLEKLRALKTSKIRDTLIEGVARKRGVDISQTPNSSSSFHGTGSSGIMIAGQRGAFDRVGLAPDADLVMAQSRPKKSSGDYKSGLSDSLLWLVKERKVDLVLHEYSVWWGLHLDGSSNHELLLDQVSALGVPQIVPAGNLALTPSKHARLILDAGASESLPIKIPGPDPRQGITSAAQITFLWHDTSVGLTFELIDPQGHAKVLSSDNTKGESWTSGSVVTLSSWRDDSPRGTAMFNIKLEGEASNTPKQLPDGTWRVKVHNPSGKPVDLWGYAIDPISGWNAGVGFGAHRSTEGTVSWPATADSAITVGAYAAHVGKPYEDTPREKSGQLRSFSGRGKRIDGTSILDIVAPDNPVTTVNRFTLGSTVHHDLGEYVVFGGTSGAGPHVAAGIALLLQKEPTLSAAEVKKRLRAGALADADVGAVPSDRWGAGKLRIYRMVFGDDPLVSTPPQVGIEAPEIYAGFEVTFRAAVRDAEDDKTKLRVRWDADYDGSFEPWGPASTAVLKRRYDKEGEVVLTKVEVKDSSGLRGAAVLRRVVQPANARPDGGPIVGDSGAPKPDGDGGVPEAGGSGGCACTVADGGGAIPSGFLWAFLSLGWVAFRRRRPVS
ncbi:MAG: S8 family serine peptidase [Deltaproteobacteria bacterium]|nr:S8 family serine peptidase [Deltaproteobacteria bacterium]